MDDKISNNYLKSMLKDSDVAICNGIAASRLIYSSYEVENFVEVLLKRM